MRDVKEACKLHGRACIDRLVFWMNSDHPKASPAAAEALLDRGYGKASQTIDLNHHTPVAHASDADLLAIATGGGRPGPAPQENTNKPGGMVH